ncbi:DUF6170 family protein [Lacimicrobium alkaliphilum]|uniref:Uncharacterized protein n=1 Tax=Lacimicrobium alkaliphilum TaxID=1526571 RepID=A0A0U3BBM1_9ALTE|nr:DUF6170 family protein [Lacimicrobium alkaliphilum]ALS99045.1 hypothetical protein AT746_12740 [Lacimicrobium alkaliphilum]
MKLYFSTRHISALRELPLTQRLALLSQASAKLSAPEKLLLNVLKLIILVPAFVLILYAPKDWLNLLWAALVLATYPLILKPVQYGLSEKYLPDNLTQGDKDHV